MIRARAALRASVAALVAVLVGACGATNPYYDPAKPHHTPEGFKNRYPHADKGSFWEWKLEQLQKGLPATPAGGWKFEVAVPDVGFLKANRTVDTLTWIGHASFLLQLDGLNILIDPHLTSRASPVSFAGPKRVVAPALDFADLPRIDIVAVSHNHYDHMDAETLTRLASQPGGPPRYFVGLGLERWFAAHGVSCDPPERRVATHPPGGDQCLRAAGRRTVDEFDWWDSRVVNGVTFTFVPVQHWSKRTLWDANETLWGGWMIESRGFRFLHVGDTGYSADFADIRRQFGPIDLAALPIGGYEPRWFMRINHADPDEAVAMHRDLGAQHSVGMHWGTFAGLTDEPLDEPPLRLQHALVREGIAPGQFFVMRPGETRLLRRGSTELPVRPPDRQAGG